MNSKILKVAVVMSDKKNLSVVLEKLNSCHTLKVGVTEIDSINNAESDCKSDVIIIDAKKDEVFDGEAFERFRSERDAPVIVIGSGKTIHLALSALQSGADDFLIEEKLAEEEIGERVISVHKKFLDRKKGRDIYRNTLIEQKKKEAINELVVTICHEFNNPLAAIKISTDILSRQKLSPEYREAVEGMERNIRLFEKKINTLRDRHS